LQLDQLDAIVHQSGHAAPTFRTLNVQLVRVVVVLLVVVGVVDYRRYVRP
jgi:hypothetical protein